MSRMPINHLPCGHMAQHQDTNGDCRLCAITATTQHQVKIAILELTVSELKEALEALGADMHQDSPRPCPTCQKVSEVLGKDWGCIETYARWQVRMQQERSI